MPARSCARRLAAALLLLQSFAAVAAAASAEPDRQDVDMLVLPGPDPVFDWSASPEPPSVLTSMWEHPKHGTLMCVGYGADGRVVVTCATEERKTVMRIQVRLDSEERFWERVSGMTVAHGKAWLMLVGESGSQAPSGQQQHFWTACKLLDTGDQEWCHHVPKSESSNKLHALRVYDDGAIMMAVGPAEVASVDNHDGDGQSEQLEDQVETEEEGGGDDNDHGDNAREASAGTVVTLLRWSSNGDAQPPLEFQSRRPGSQLLALSISNARTAEARALALWAYPVPAGESDAVPAGLPASRLDVMQVTADGQEQWWPWSRDAHSWTHARASADAGAVVAVGNTERVGELAWRPITAHSTHLPAHAHAARARLSNGMLVLMLRKSPANVPEEMGLGSNQVWRSADGGMSWELATDKPGWSEHNGAAGVLQDDTIVLVGANGREVWASTDAGSTWKLQGQTPWPLRQGFSVVGRGDALLVMGGQSVAMLHLLFADLWRSTDAGKTWTQLSTKLEWPERYNAEVALLPGGRLVLAGGLTGQGSSTQLRSDVWTSTDGALSWTRAAASAEFGGRVGHALVPLSATSLLLVAGGTRRDGNTYDRASDVWRSNDSGASWTRVTASAAFARAGHGLMGHAAALDADGKLFVAAGEHRLPADKGAATYLTHATWRSSDHGASWQEAVRHWSRRAWHAAVGVGEGVVVLAGGRDETGKLLNDVWRSTDGGATWARLTDAAPWSPRVRSTLLAVPPVKASGSGSGSGSGSADDAGYLLLVGGQVGDGEFTTDVWRSDDLGATWQRMTAAAGWGSQAYAVATVAKSRAVVVAYHGEVWGSTDGGRTWQQRAWGLAYSSSVGQLLATETNGDLIYTTGTTTYWSTSEGVFWHLMGHYRNVVARDPSTVVTLPSGGVMTVGQGSITATTRRFASWITFDHGYNWNRHAFLPHPVVGAALVMLASGRTLVLGGVANPNAAPHESAMLPTSEVVAFDWQPRVTVSVYGQLDSVQSHRYTVRRAEKVFVSEDLRSVTLVGEHSRWLSPLECVIERYNVADDSSWFAGCQGDVLDAYFLPGTADTMFAFKPVYTSLHVVAARYNHHGSATLWTPVYLQGNEVVPPTVRITPGPNGRTVLIGMARRRVHEGSRAAFVMAFVLDKLGWVNAVDSQLPGEAGWGGMLGLTVVPSGRVWAAVYHRLSSSYVLDGWHIDPLAEGSELQLQLGPRFELTMPFASEPAEIDEVHADPLALSGVAKLVNTTTTWVGARTALQDLLVSHHSRFRFDVAHRGSVPGCGRPRGCVATLALTQRVTEWHQLEWWLVLETATDAPVLSVAAPALHHGNLNRCNVVRVDVSPRWGITVVGECNQPFTMEVHEQRGEDRLDTDVLVVRWSATGQLLWVGQAGSRGDDAVLDLFVSPLNGGVTVLARARGVFLHAHTFPPAAEGDELVPSLAAAVWGNDGTFHGAWHASSRLEGRLLASSMDFSARVLTAVASRDAQPSTGSGGSSGSGSNRGVLVHRLRLMEQPEASAVALSANVAGLSVTSTFAWGAMAGCAVGEASAGWWAGCWSAERTGLGAATLAPAKPTEMRITAAAATPQTRRMFVAGTVAGALAGKSGAGKVDVALAALTDEGTGDVKVAWTYQVGTKGDDEPVALFAQYVQHDPWASTSGSSGSGSSGSGSDGAASGSVHAGVEVVVLASVLDGTLPAAQGTGFWESEEESVVVAAMPGSGAGAGSPKWLRTLGSPCSDTVDAMRVRAGRGGNVIVAVHGCFGERGAMATGIFQLALTDGRQQWATVVPDNAIRSDVAPLLAWVSARQRLVGLELPLRADRAPAQLDMHYPTREADVSTRLSLTGGDNLVAAHQHAGQDASMLVELAAVDLCSLGSAAAPCSVRLTRDVALVRCPRVRLWCSAEEDWTASVFLPGDGNNTRVLASFDVPAWTLARDFARSTVLALQDGVAYPDGMHTALPGWEVWLPVGGRAEYNFTMRLGSHGYDMQFPRDTEAGEWDFGTGRDGSGLLEFDDDHANLTHPLVGMFLPPRPTRCAANATLQELGGQELEAVHVLSPTPAGVPRHIATQRHEASLRVLGAGEVEVCFVHSNSWHRNELGYFAFTSQHRVYDAAVLFPDLSAGAHDLTGGSGSGSGSGSSISAGGCVQMGQCVRMGPFPRGTRLGFYLAPDRAIGDMDDDEALNATLTSVPGGAPAGQMFLAAYDDKADAIVLAVQDELEREDDDRPLAARRLLNDHLFLIRAPSGSKASLRTVLDTAHLHLTSHGLLKHRQCPARDARVSNMLRVGWTDYALLDNTQPGSSAMGCQTEVLRVPQGWRLAPASPPTFAALAEQPWGSECVVLADGHAYRPADGRACNATTKYLAADAPEGCPTLLRCARILLARDVPAAATGLTNPFFTETEGRLARGWAAGGTGYALAEGSACGTGASLRLTGDGHLSTASHQLAPASVVDGVTVSVWSRAENVLAEPSAAETVYGMYVVIAYQGGGETHSEVTGFDWGTQPWTYGEATVFPLPGRTVTSVRAYFELRGATGSAFFSCVGLRSAGGNLVRNPRFREDALVEPQRVEEAGGDGSAQPLVRSPLLAWQPLSAANVTFSLTTDDHYPDATRGRALRCAGSAAVCGALQDLSFSQEQQNRVQAVAGWQALLVSGCARARDVRLSARAGVARIMRGRTASGGQELADLLEDEGTSVGGAPQGMVQFGINVDIWYADGEHDLGLALPFSEGTYDWRCFARVVPVRGRVSRMVVTVVALEFAAEEVAVDHVAVVPLCNAPTRLSAAYGDPHMVSTASVTYDMLLAGDFALLRDGAVALHARYSPAGPLGSAVTGLALQSGSLVVALARAPPGERSLPEAWVQGSRVHLAPGHATPLPAVHRAGATLRVQGTLGSSVNPLTYSLLLPSGHAVDVVVRITRGNVQYFDVVARLPKPTDATGAGMLTGTFPATDGVAPRQVQLSEGASLLALSGVPRQTGASAFVPRNPLERFSSDEVDVAAGECRKHVSNTALVFACVVDVLSLGDNSAALSAHMVQQQLGLGSRSSMSMRTWRDDADEGSAATARLSMAVLAVAAMAVVMAQRRFAL